jgi:hypothetical protein
LTNRLLKRLVTPSARPIVARRLLRAVYSGSPSGRTARSLTSKTPRRSDFRPRSFGTRDRDPAATLDRPLRPANRRTGGGAFGRRHSLPSLVLRFWSLCCASRFALLHGPGTSLRPRMTRLYGLWPARSLRSCRSQGLHRASRNRLPAGDRRGDCGTGSLYGERDSPGRLRPSASAELVNQTQRGGRSTSKGKKTHGMERVLLCWKQPCGTTDSSVEQRLEGERSV